MAHYQFEAIHPFEDGNGRTGRIINVLMLMSAGLISEPILYLSRYITSGANADLLAVLFEQPYRRISNVIQRCGVSRPTATNWLNALVGTGALLSIRTGRERIFINKRFLELLMRPESVPGGTAVSD